jgi:hypothetical protein
VCAAPVSTTLGGEDLLALDVRWWILLMEPLARVPGPWEAFGGDLLKEQSLFVLHEVTALEE